MRSYWSATIFTALCGLSRIRMLTRRAATIGRTSGVRPLSPNQASLATVRQFQSETDAIREAAEPIFARATIFVLAGFVVAIVAIMCLTRLDRVISSVGGKIVPVD